VAEPWSSTRINNARINEYVNVPFTTRPVCRLLRNNPNGKLIPKYMIKSHAARFFRKKVTLYCMSNKKRSRF
jgi:hypothetical protein